MDGVLVDAKDWHYRALNKALKDYGHEISTEDHISLYDGLPTREKLKIMSERISLDLSLHEEIFKLKQDYTKEEIKKNCEPSPQHISAVSKLKIDGYHIALASNSTRESIKLLMQKSNLLDFFEFYLSNEDVSKAKPDPEIYNVAIKKLGLNPSECLILEDNENGIQAAIASGAHLLKIKNFQDVTYENIIQKIKNIEASDA